MPSQLCVIAFLGCLLFILVLVYLLTRTSVEGPVPKTFREVYKAFREAKNWTERAFVVFICLPWLFRESYKILIGVISILAIVGLLAVCGSPAALPQLNVVRDILWLIYKILSK